MSVVDTDSSGGAHDHIGYAVGSLALVADSFHMLKCVDIVFMSVVDWTNDYSDVMSLIVALYAIKVSGLFPGGQGSQYHLTAGEKRSFSSILLRVA